MDVRALLMGLAFAAMWASAFTSARIIVADAPPLSTLAVRFLISGLIALVLATVAAVVILASLGSAYRGARTNTIKAITTGAEAPRQDPVWVARWAGRLGLPIPLVLGLNDTFATTGGQGESRIEMSSVDMG